MIRCVKFDLKLIFNAVLTNISKECQTDDR